MSVHITRVVLPGRLAPLLTCALILLAAQPAVSQTTKPPSRVRVYYFGNSLTGNTMPVFHPELGRSAGKQWIMARSQGAGWQLLQHLHTKGPAKHRAAIAGGEWDAIVLQPFGARLFNEKVSTMYGKLNFDPPIDVGDLHCSVEIFKLLLKGSRKGRLLIYSDWCPINMAAMGFDRKDAQLKKLAGDLTFAPQWHQVMQPYRLNFSYEKTWLSKYDPNADPPWTRKTATRDHDYQLMEALKKQLPEAWKQQRLQMIPTGDVWLALDRKARAGNIPGVRNIADYYTNNVHIRSGLPRYTAAAVFYACIFRDHPGNLDWKVYNDRSKYMNTNRWICCEKDLGVHLEITPELARIINDTIWEVVTDHPYTGITENK